MIVVIGIVFFILFVVLTLFVSKKFSPIPYFPSQKVDVPLIVKALSLKNNQAVFDLGAGDGIVIFDAAKYAYEKKLNTFFVAVDINPVLILILHFRRLFHPNKRNIKIMLGDMFKMNFRNQNKPITDNRSLTTVYLYISPWFLEKVSQKILAEFPRAKIVSYMYPIKSLGKYEKIVEGKNRIFIYTI